VVPGVGTGEPVAFLLTANGQKDFVTQQVQGRLLPAGWYDDHTLVWVRWHKDPESGTTVGSASVILTDLHGRVVERFPLRLGKVWTDPPDSSSVSVSPGGEILALGTDQGPDLSVWWFHLRGPSRGHVKAELAPSAYADPSGCPASWSDTIQLPGAGYPDTVLAAPGGASTIQADPRLRIGCSVWASDALRGAGVPRSHSSGLRRRRSDQDGQDLVAVLALAPGRARHPGRAARRRGRPGPVAATAARRAADGVTACWLGWRPPTPRKDLL
jgi:hypothetical protein